MSSPVARDALGPPVDDEPAQPAEADDRPDRRRRDDVEDRGPEAAHDHRRGERELDVGEDLPLAHAHSAGRLDEVAVDLAQPGIGVDEDRRDREQDHRDERRDEVEAVGREQLAARSAG